MKHESREEKERWKGTHVKCDKGGNQIQEVTCVSRMQKRECRKKAPTRIGGQSREGCGE